MGVMQKVILTKSEAPWRGDGFWGSGLATVVSNFFLKSWGNNRALVLH